MGTFALNQWYVAAWSDDVCQSPFGRMLCGIPVVLYRQRDGTVVALEDACPHRLLPLSLGSVDGDAIRCKYHGLLLGSDGICIEMPGQDPVNRAVRTRAFPLVERYRFLWIWLGAPELANPASIPDLWMNEHPEWRVAGGTYHVACDYRLVIDNLMDLTHEATVHASTIGQKELHEFPIETNAEDGRVTTSKWMAAVPAPPLYKKALGGHAGLVDRWQICEYYPPAGILIDVGVAPVELKSSLKSHDVGVRSFILDFITPETESSCHYMWGSARSFDIDDDESFNALTNKQGEVFLEDVEVLEAQQRSMELLPERKLRAFKVDSGGVRARILLDRLIAAEI